ncbi:MAG: hypothetical protein QF879_12670 [Candidatus Latescibacteria bacterium]|nr:hypothetical protein [Candidatus Latescibacterota bacterium]
MPPESTISGFLTGLFRRWRLAGNHRVFKGQGAHNPDQWLFQRLVSAGR